MWQLPNCNIGAHRLKQKHCQPHIPNSLFSGTNAWPSFEGIRHGAEVEGGCCRSFFNIGTVHRLWKITGSFPVPGGTTRKLARHNVPGMSRQPNPSWRDGGN